MDCIIKLTLCKWILFLLIINYYLVCRKFTAEDRMLVVFGTGLANRSKMSSCNFEWKCNVVRCALHICLCIVCKWLALLVKGVWYRGRIATMWSLTVGILDETCDLLHEPMLLLYVSRCPTCQNTVAVTVAVTQVHLRHHTQLEEEATPQGPCPTLLPPGPTSRKHCSLSVQPQPSSAIAHTLYLQVTFQKWTV